MIECSASVSYSVVGHLVTQSLPKEQSLPKLICTENMCPKEICAKENDPKKSAQIKHAWKFFQKKHYLGRARRHWNSPVSILCSRHER